jgi:effector-binding domain-containing protein
MKEQPALDVLSVRSRVPVQELPQFFSRVYGAIGQYIGELGEQPEGGVFALYHNLDMQNMDVEAGFTVSKPLPGKGEIQPGTVPGGTYAICHYTGPYDQMDPAYDFLKEYAHDRGYKVGEIIYEWYLNGPDVPPQELQTDIAFPAVHIEKHVPV